jgi:pimeloyl-ACP methyl ester carboxylesterase
MESTAVQIRPAEPASTITVQPGRDGLALTLQNYGEPSSARLLYTHGFGQNRQAWHGAATQLTAAGWHGVALDGRGHGDSEWSADGRYELDDFAADLRLVAGRLPQKPILVGASMGGLLGLMCEGEEPGLFAALILVDVTPRWETTGVERILNFMAANPQGFESLQAAADAVSDYLPHRERKDPERLASQLRLTPEGRWRWHWDPRLLQQVIVDAHRDIPRMQAAAARIDIPVLLLSGGRSDVISSQTIAEFLCLVPHAEHVCIEDATHMVVGDRNDVFTREIARYLERVTQSKKGPSPADLSHKAQPRAVPTPGRS